MPSEKIVELTGIEPANYIGGPMGNRTPDFAVQRQRVTASTISPIESARVLLCDNYYTREDTYLILLLLSQDPSSECSES
jgi:hypothetical protein